MKSIRDELIALQRVEGAYGCWMRGKGVPEGSADLSARLVPLHWNIGGEILEAVIQEILELE